MATSLLSQPRIPGLVSVVVPCYRQSQFLAECVRSLQRQTHPDWEAIVVGDSAEDGMAAAIFALIKDDSRIRFLKHSNNGPSAARNVALASSRGEYIQFLDADDLLVETKLSQQIQFLERTPDVGIVYGNAWYFPHGRPDIRYRQGFGGDSMYDWINAAAAAPGPILHKLLVHNVLPICTPLVRSSVIAQVGGMDETLQLLEDWEFWLRCASHEIGFHYEGSEQTDALIRLHRSSLSQNRTAMQDATLGMRLVAWRYMQSPIARRLMLNYLAPTLNLLSPLERDSVLKTLSAGAMNLNEQAAIALARMTPPYTHRRQILMPLLRRLPWRLRLLVVV